ncbi:MAG: cbb3-type cytochrome c oxidase subunit 3 [Dongiaceae bacterium]
MDYDTIRHFADSWGLLFLLAVFVTAVGWAFRPGSSYQSHADIPFRNENEKD